MSPVYRDVYIIVFCGALAIVGGISTAIFVARKSHPIAALLGLVLSLAVAAAVMLAPAWLPGQWAGLAREVGRVMR